MINWIFCLILCGNQAFWTQNHPNKWIFYPWLIYVETLSDAFIKGGLKDLPDCIAYILHGF